MSAEKTLRDEIDFCRGCEACRSLMDDSCHVFPELYRLVDREAETGEKITTDDLRRLVELCNFCGLCPCHPFRSAILNAKTGFKDEYGLGFGIRTIENVAGIGKLGTAFSRFVNALFQNEAARRLLENTFGIHKDRKFPVFPEETFPQWISKRKKNVKADNKGLKVAYFAGCTARYFFPEVAKSFIDVFEKNGIEIAHLEQKCCSMPSLLEGDRERTLEAARFNVPRLVDAVKAGYDIVCSCPTCGYMLKNVLKRGACYSPELLNSEQSDDGFVKIPLTYGSSYVVSAYVFKHLFEGLLKDDGYFSSITPWDRMLVANNTYDAGEYLRALHLKGGLNTRFGSVEVNAAYYPPCHLREQNIGKPYEDLLQLVPGISIDSIKGIYCCGNAGIMGFKREYHHLSIKTASRLIAKIKSLDPEVLTTDCLSCRIQFNQLTAYEVYHPIQLISESYRNYKGFSGENE